MKKKNQTNLKEIDPPYLIGVLHCIIGNGYFGNEKYLLRFLTLLNELKARDQNI